MTENQPQKQENLVVPGEGGGGSIGLQNAGFTGSHGQLSQLSLPLPDSPETLHRYSSTLELVPDDDKKYKKSPKSYHIPVIVEPSSIIVGGDEKKNNYGQLDNNYSEDNSQSGKVSPVQPKKTLFVRYGGMLMTVVASFFFSFSSVCVKFLAPFGFQAYSSTFWRYTGVSIPAFPMLMYYEYNARAKSETLFCTVWPLNKRENFINAFGLFIRGLLGATAVVLRYYALFYINIMDMNVISYSTPMLVTVLAYFFLGEPIGFIPILTGAVALGGVFIISKPPALTGATEFDERQLIGIMLSVGSLIAGALMIIITRKIRKVHFSVMTFGFGLIGMGLCFTLAMSFNVFQAPSQTEDSLWTLALGIVSFLGQMAIILAVQFEQCGPVALLRSCDAIFGLINGYFFFNEIPDKWSGVGGSIIMFALFIMGLRKWFESLPKTDSRRKAWWIFWILK